MCVYRGENMCVCLWDRQSWLLGVGCKTISINKIHLNIMILCCMMLYQFSKTHTNKHWFLINHLNAKIQGETVVYLAVLCMCLNLCIQWCVLYVSFPKITLKKLHYIVLLTVLQYITIYWIITTVSWYVSYHQYRQYTALMGTISKWWHLVT